MICQHCNSKPAIYIVRNNLHLCLPCTIAFLDSTLKPDKETEQ